ncbi:MAG: hypothetical protein AB7V43_17040 [Acidimicrobiia bacterium]
MSPPDPHDREPSSIAELRELVELQRDTVTAVATGTSMDTLRGPYRQQRSKLRVALQRRGLKEPFPWADVNVVWAWAKQWPTYAERRAEVANLVAPLLDQLDDLERGGKVDDWGGSPDEWTELELRVAGLRDEMDGATTLDHYQDVGRRGREVVIDVVNLLFEADMVTDVEHPPKGSDAKAKFDLIVQAYAIGSSHAELRALMRAAWDLNQKVTHGAITRVDAYAAAQATVLIVRTLAAMHDAGRSQR